jgi:SpoVK/Ycf46/Vps4 family AAA+-type ATPase
MNTLSIKPRLSRHKPDEDLHGALSPLIKIWMCIIYKYYQPPRSSELQSDIINISQHEIEAIEFQPDCHLLPDRDLFNKHIDSVLQYPDQLKFIIPDVIHEKLKTLSEFLRLSKVEQKLLLFAVSRYLSEGFDYLLSECKWWSRSKTIEVIAHCLNEPVESIRCLFSTHNLLIDAGIIAGDFEKLNDSGSLASFLTMPESFVRYFLETDYQIENCFTGLFVRCAAPTVNEKDFSHLKNDLEIVKRLLRRRSLRSKILIHGLSGVGKTQLGLLLATLTDNAPFQIVNASEKGKPLSPIERLTIYSRAQQYLSHHRNAVILFDDINIIFPDTNRNVIHSDQINTFWVRDIVRKSQIPSIWVVNSSQSLPSSILNEFDFVLEVVQPSVTKKVKLVTETISNTPIDNLTRQTITTKSFTPKLLHNASRIANQLAKKKKHKNRIFRHILDAQFRAQTNESIGIQTDSQPPLFDFDIELVNAAPNPRLFVDKIRAVNTARLCFYGVPGSGKSALARYIAKIKNKQLIVKRASDILRPFVGQTEIQIKNMFNDAIKSDAILLLDEVDTFLRSREMAYRSWEVSKVNELLSQMESFNGVLICTTNMMSNFDTAALRRFDLKMEFFYLSAQQVWKCFRKLSEQHGFKLAPNSAIRNEVMRCTRISLGDFVTLHRQFAFLKPSSVEDILDRLKQEQRCKEIFANEGSKIGFY